MDTTELYQGAVAIYAARMARYGPPTEVAPCAEACVAEAAVLWQEAHRQAPAMVRQVVAETVARVAAWAPVAEDAPPEGSEAGARAVAVVARDVDFLALDREGAA